MSVRVPVVFGSCRLCFLPGAGGARVAGGWGRGSALVATQTDLQDSRGTLTGVVCTMIRKKCPMATVTVTDGRKF